MISYQNKNSKVDFDSSQWLNNRGEFSLEGDFAFEQHLKSLQRYVNFFKKKIPCLKGQEFISYVLNEEGYKYSTNIRSELI